MIQAIKIEWVNQRVARSRESRVERADIRGEKLEIHAQDIVGKSEVACSDSDRIPRFSKGM